MPRPVYQLFLERCLLIEAVQQHRDEEAVLFFTTGCWPGAGLLRALNYTDLTWMGARWPPTAPASLRAGWEAMDEACRLLVAELQSGKIRLAGTSPAGLRRAILPAELAWPGLGIDFQYSELVDCSDYAALWKDVTESAGELPARAADLIARNAERDAVQEAKWAQWQAAADPIGKAHPLWSKRDVAVRVKKVLKVTESADTIRKRIKRTW
jgi:hypothetical protein